MYFVYILECSDKSLYVGYTTNVKKRVLAHNTLKVAARYTKSRRPVKLKYFEKFKTLSGALKREIEIKSWPRKSKLLLIQK